ncbi:hypothetical protein PACTADRAFT_18721 [Pachysolen tannophilus NRRL Y-2460]|uniref:Uncharacterized protein n=1 Tax=Pachysolen tannophilus NRRL Y-2460 TaxID=669874 RepID=A0A1E4TN92_PACTA|nr:hypothetical protein PACTADRAFT_18721 [Pachysolen tannophilus NRRL Y-2460]
MCEAVTDSMLKLHQEIVSCEAEPSALNNNNNSSRTRYSIDQLLNLKDESFGAPNFGLRERNIINAIDDSFWRLNKYGKQKAGKFRNLNNLDTSSVGRHYSKSPIITGKVWMDDRNNNNNSNNKKVTSSNFASGKENLPICIDENGDPQAGKVQTHNIGVKKFIFNDNAVESAQIFNPSISYDNGANHRMAPIIRYDSTDSFKAESTDSTPLSECEKNDSKGNRKVFNPQYPAEFELAQTLSQQQDTMQNPRESLHSNYYANPINSFYSLVQQPSSPSSHSTNSSFQNHPRPAFLFQGNCLYPTHQHPAPHHPTHHHPTHHHPAQIPYFKEDHIHYHSDSEAILNSRNQYPRGMVLVSSAAPNAAQQALPPVPSSPFVTGPMHLHAHQPPPGPQQTHRYGYIPNASSNCHHYHHHHRNHNRSFLPPPPPPPPEFAINTLGNGSSVPIPMPIPIYPPGVIHNGEFFPVTHSANSSSHECFDEEDSANTHNTADAAANPIRYSSSMATTCYDADQITYRATSDIDKIAGINNNNSGCSVIDKLNAEEESNYNDSTSNGSSNTIIIKID